MNTVQIQTPKDTYTVDYPQAIKAAEQQMNVLWFSEELGVDKDEGDIRKHLTEGERHGVETVLRLFTKYELHIGDDFWTTRFQKMFPRPDMQRMANCFAFVEINIHAPFYDLINKTLGIATDEFYNSWKYSPTLRDRAAFIDKHINEHDDLVSLSAFSFMEGAVLYSSFAFLKSFNTNGFNMIPHITAGIDASAGDENFHMLASTWSYRQLLAEKKEAGMIDDEYEEELAYRIREIAKTVYDHECYIVDMIFSKGGVRTITKDEIKHFVRNRIDLVLQNLGQKVLFGDGDGTVSEWFYEHINSYKHSDFFASTQIQYTRNWNRSELKFKASKQEEQKEAA